MGCHESINLTEEDGATVLRKLVLCGRCLLIVDRILRNTYMSTYKCYYHGQVTIDLDGRTETFAKAVAQAAGISLSKWIGGVMQAKAANDWPESIKALASAWQ